MIKKYRHLVISIIQKVCSFFTIITLLKKLKVPFVHDREHFEKIAEQTRSTNAYLVEQVQNYLFQHINENITLSDLGEIFGINYSSLSNIFSSTTGQTIIEYLTFIRILHAKELLINTDKKIYEICSEIGYTEPKYFIKRFRQIVGVTPKEYRKIYTS